MKVAIVHDYIKEYGGAERVLEALHDIFPDVTVYISVYLPEFLGPHRKRFEDWNIKTSWADILPFRAKLISPLRVIAPELFKSLDLSKYDVVIVSATGAYSPNTIKTKSEKHSAVHICYTHTPPRYLYGYETARDWKKNPITRYLGTLTIHFLRMVDFNSSKNVDFFIANSQETKRRIGKFYRKNAIVIYPPVESMNHESRIKNQAKRGDYYLTGGRIARAKHTDLIADTFIKNGLPLKIFGKGFAGFEDEIRERIKDKLNIEFLGEVSDEKKNELMAGAKAFIIASEDEDFGIVPVEAMMFGTPVISHRSGGPLETVIEGKTGLFFDEFSTESLNSAIKKFEKTKFNSMEIKKHAQKFSKKRFEKEIQEFVNDKIKAK
jgi:glycosyltransferase involved in cell wall biosynthesis